MSIVATAPGKIVVAGEYAVLVGAPALAVAVNRRVRCAIDESGGNGWTFATHGFAPDAAHTLDALLNGPLVARTDPAHLCQHVLRQMQSVGASPDALPADLRIDIDSSAGFDGGRKLGIGTSAAVCAALTAALLERRGSRLVVFPIALAAHRSAQGGSGSGIDVASSCTGGLIRYEMRPTPRSPASRFRTAFPTRSSGPAPAPIRASISCTSTRGATAAIPRELGALIDAAGRVTDALGTASEFMRELRAYAAVLRALDDTARLGIYGNAHRRLSELGSEAGVVYKPCGAGGGDLGMAFANDTTAIESFARAARAAGFKRLPVELDEHGITVGVER